MPAPPVPRQTGQRCDDSRPDAVRVTDEKRDGRLEGTVERVLERAHRILLGVWDPTTADASDQWTDDQRRDESANGQRGAVQSGQRTVDVLLVAQ